MLTLRHCEPSSPFFVDVRAEEASADPELEVEMPGDWLAAMEPGDAWRSLWPMGVPARTHGWKLHLSSVESHYKRMVAITSAVCFELGAPFKYVPRWATVRAFNAKDADRSSAGKLITIYPASSTALDALSERLDVLLAGTPNPYVLGDVRFRSGPVHFRFGGFMPLTIPDDAGAEVLARPDADGVLERDERRPVFVAPADRSRLPNAVSEAVRVFESHDDIGALSQFKGLEPIQFSNAGGVYCARREDGTPALLKEARAHAGLDARGRDARTRLGHEWRNLQRLEHTGIAPRPLDRFEVWEHSFVEMEYVHGRTLQHRTSSSLPELGPDDTAQNRLAYASSTLKLLYDLEDKIRRCHEAGVVVGDLHPGNVMVQEDGSVRLIDLEDDRMPSSTERTAFNALGYEPPRGLTAAQGDWFALARVVVSAFEPRFARELLTPQFWTVACERAGGHYGRSVLDLVHRIEERHPQAPGQRMFAVGKQLAPTLKPLLDREPGLRASRLAAGVEAVWSAPVGTKPPRRLPCHPIGDSAGRDVTVARGTAGAVLAVGRLLERDPNSMLDQLETVSLVGELPVGLLNGSSGVSAVLREFGRVEAAERLERVDRHRLRRTRSTALADGVAGIALGQAGIDNDFLIDAARLIEARTLCRNGENATTRALDARPGLYFGWTGLSLFFAVTFALTADPRWADRSVDAFERETRHLADQSRGLLEPAGSRSFPYLSNGTAGMLVALAELRGLCVVDERHRLWQQYAVPLLRSCSGTMYVFDGLARGAAGVLVGLTAMRKWQPEAASLLERLDAEICSRTVEWNGHIHTHGDDLIRLSADHETGSTGVSLALHCRRAGALAWLPGAFFARGSLSNDERR